MTTGTGHYEFAEQLLRGEMGIALEADERIARAQVHATLALAAATAMSGRNGMHEFDWDAWDKVCGTQEDDDVAPGGTDG